MPFSVPKIVYIFDHQMSIFKHYSFKSKFGNKEKVITFNIWNIMWPSIFEIFQIWTKCARLESISPPFPSLKHWQAINFQTLASNQHLIYNYRETIKQWNKVNILWEVLKDCINFSRKVRNKIFKNFSFSRCHLNILLTCTK